MRQSIDVTRHRTWTASLVLQHTNSYCTMNSCIYMTVKQYHPPSVPPSLLPLSHHPPSVPDSASTNMGSQLQFSHLVRGATWRDGGDQGAAGTNGFPAGQTCFPLHPLCASTSNAPPIDSGVLSCATVPEAPQTARLRRGVHCPAEEGKGRAGAPSTGRTAILLVERETLRGQRDRRSRLWRVSMTD